MTSRTSKKSRSKYRIINIRGTNGSGKSFVTRKLMERCEVKPIYGAPKRGELIGKIEAYRGEFRGKPIFFIGSYEAMSGGCDATMKEGGFDLVCDMVRKYAGQGHVIFEGFMLTGVFQRFYDLSQELGGITWAFMDTPLEVCIKRIKRRNEEKGARLGKARKSMGTKHVEQKVIEGNRTRRKFKERGEHVVLIDHKRPFAALCKILKT